MNPDNNIAARRREVGAARRARTQEKLIAAAARVVGEVGEQRATIDEIIMTAKLARGTFYNYYPSREALLEDLWERIGHDPLHGIQLVLSSVEDPAERIAGQAQQVMARAAADPLWGWLVYAFSAADKVPEDLLSYPKPDLIIGQRSGRFRLDDINSASDLIVCTVRTGLRNILQNKCQSNEGYIRSLLTLLLRAIGVSDEDAAAVLARLSEYDPVHTTRGSSPQIPK